MNNVRFYICLHQHGVGWGGVGWEVLNLPMTVPQQLVHCTGNNWI